jgi:hypothetical protein
MTRAMLGIVVFALAVAGARAGLAGQVRSEIVPVDPLTASISGRVTTETGAPLRRAEVRATSNGGLTRFTTTDTDGRYVVRDLPAGAFTLHVSKSGFVPLYFGQRRPFERRTTLQIVPGTRVSADIRLPRAGAITGRIVDRTGEPVMGVRVQALRRRMVDGLRGLQATGATDTTDDQGSYRVYGLPPGEYYVTATPRRVEDTAGRPAAGTILGRGTPIYYPGTANRDEAQRITVEVSGEARADLVLTEVRTSRVSGIVLTSNGTPATGAMVSLLSRDLSVGSGDPADGLTPLQLMDDADAEGRFDIQGVPPGSFILRVNTRPSVSLPFDPATQRFTARPVLPPMETAIVPVAVDGDVAGLTVSTSPGGTVEIVLVPDQGVTEPLPDNVRVTVRMGDRSELGLMTMSHGTGASNIDIRGSIQANALELLPAGGGPVPGQGMLTLPAPARVSVDGLPANWALKAVLLGNEDVTDQPVAPRDGQTKTLRVVLTDKLTAVVGSIASTSFTDNGNSAQAFVLVFADDEKRWSYPSRFIRTARADRGRFTVTGLPPNEEYRAVAVDYLEDGEEYDQDFLKQMRQRAARFSLREGEQVAVDLRLVQR